MAPSAGKSLTLGFLDVVGDDASGYRGGYLLTNEFGRPIEFHHTTPVTVSRQDRLLHGAGFESYLFVDTLAKPMTDRQSAAPRLIVVGQPILLELRRQIPAPVVHLVGGERESAVARALEDHASDQAAFEKLRGLAPPQFDWLEPLGRIRAALEESRAA